MLKHSFFSFFEYERPSTHRGTDLYASNSSPSEKNASEPFFVKRIAPKSLLGKQNVDNFLRMIRVQMLSSMGDVVFTVGLAGTIFFNSDPTQARWRVALYLALTVIPFILIAPFVSPLMDKFPGGRKWSLFGAAAGRALLCFMIMRDLSSIWFYPEVFLMLVLGKVHMISKSALIPTVVNDNSQLVKANAQLSLFAAISGGLAGILALGINWFGSAWTTALAMILFAVAAWQIVHLPNNTIAPEEPSEKEIQEMKSESILLSVKAITAFRAMLGFVIFFSAFHFKSADKPLWWLGVFAACAQIGYFSGIVSAPALRKFLKEAQVITVSMVALTVVTVFSTVLLFSRTIGQATVLLSLGLIAFVLGGAASSAKLAFDALVQQDAPDANMGRLFANFETRFQVAWATAALAAVLLPFSPNVMLVSVAGGLTGFMVYYILQRRHIKFVSQEEIGENI